MKLFLVGGNGEIKNVNPLIRETKKNPAYTRRGGSSTLRDEIQLMLHLASNLAKEEKTSAPDDTDLLSEKCA